MTEICIVLIVFIVTASIIIAKWLDQSCKHEWEIVQRVSVDADGECDYARLYLRCKKCGKCKCKK